MHREDRPARSCGCAACRSSRFFETSFGRILRSHVPARARRGRGPRGLGRGRRRSEPVLQLGDDRDGLAHHHEVPRAAACSARTSTDPRQVFPALRARARPQHGQGGRRDGGVGSRSRAARGSRSPRCSAARAITSPRACRSASRTRSISCWRRIEHELAAGYRRIKIKIKPGWDVDVVERVRAALRRRAADGRRQRRVHGRRRRAPRAARRVRPDDDRAAARLRRHDGSRARCSGAADADLPRRVDSHGADRARTRSTRAPAGSSTSSRARRRPSANRSGCTICAPRTAFRCGTAACSKPASAARTTSTWRACPTSRCRATSPRAVATSQPDLIDPPIEVAARRHDSGARRSRHRRAHHPGARRRVDRARGRASMLPL